MRTPTARLREWDRERHTKSPLRAGVYARRKARVRHRQFVRRNWWLLTRMSLIAGVAFAPTLILTHGEARAFAAGLLVAGLVGFLTVFVLLFSGTAATLMSELAEQWTAASLSKAAHGWRVVSGVRLRRVGDIDHVAVGPAGVVVAESKWSSEGWEDNAFTRDRIDRARRQVAANANDVWRHLSRAVPTRAVVVLWGVGVAEVHPDLRIRRFENADVVVGPALDEWARGLPTDAPPDQVDVAWTSLSRSVARRDEHDAAHEPPMPRSVGDVITAVWVGVIGAASAIVVSMAVVVASQSMVWGFVAIAALVGSAMLLRAVAFTRPFGTGLLAGGAAAATLLVGVLVYVYGTALLR